MTGLEASFEGGVRSAQHDSPVAEMLCAICQESEETRNPWVFKVHPGIDKWWAEHKRRDAAKAKRERERLRRQEEAELRALAKKLGKKVI